ncbi:hypothetical protein MUBE_12480 [Mycobacterium uberis]|uniref:ARB-07466-like C-terminal domain-containing protein n=1 Tax=Mycobacterium uberis TaxID=2162698 RepID=A0A3E1HE50_9MYCO|nr:hypothetical protein MUBE_12480 [Mycobacterium uberis]
MLAAVLVPAAALFTVAGDAHSRASRNDAKPVVADVPACCLQIVPAVSTANMPESAVAVRSHAGQHARVSRWRVDNRSRFLPVGVASEQGLQVRTILAARAISAAFSMIREIGGVRPDSLRWHPQGFAIDVMVPNAGTAEGIALGNAIVAFVFDNATRFGMQDVIWRGVYYTPSGAKATGFGHYDHVHVTTTGGGYPTGRENYLR